jgi:hypothetical protein
MGICGTKGERFIKILVLGISGSGKSTFSKQMKILFGEGFNDDEKITYVNIVRANVLQGIKELAEQASNRGLDVKERHRKHIRFFKENDVFQLNLCEKDILKKVTSLWGDSAIQEAWNLCRNYQIQVSQIEYFMENLDRITKSDFVPNDDDIVRARQRTAGAYSTRFTAFKHTWEIIDVGGQTPERKKWISIVQEGFANSIFFASLDEYNMESSEEPGKTKMEVSMRVFEEVINDQENYKSFFILFLTKKDLFREKLLSKKGRAEFDEKFPDFEKFLKDFDPTQQEEDGNGKDNKQQEEEIPDKKK